MKSRTFWLIGSAFVLVSGIGGMVACSASGSGEPGGATGGDAGFTATENEGGGADATSQPPANDAGAAEDTGAADLDAGAASDCGKPAKFFHTADAGAYCPYGPDGSVSCAIGEHCCEYAATAKVPSTCNAAATACAAGIEAGADWGCDEPSDCPSGSVCCLTGTVKKDVCGPYGSTVRGTACVAASACPQGEVALCGQASDCVTGTTCEAFKAKGKQLGACL